MNPHNPAQPLPRKRPILGCCAPSDERYMPRYMLDWLGHIQAGRIGNNPPTPPEVAARRARNEAVLRGYGRCR